MNPEMKKGTPEFERKFAEVRKVTQRHTIESLTVYAGEYIRELEDYIIQRNGVYEGKVLTKTKS
jgi:hypothetical protein